MPSFGMQPLFGAEVHNFSGHIGSIAGVAFSPDGRYVLTGSYDGTAALWNIATGVVTRVFGISSVCFCFQRGLLTGWKIYIDGQLRQYCPIMEMPGQGAQVRTFKGHTYPVMIVTFSIRWKICIDGQRRQYRQGMERLRRQALVRTFSGQTGPVLSVEFSPDGKYVLAGSQDGTAWLWNSATGAGLHTWSMGIPGR